MKKLKIYLPIILLAAGITWLFLSSSLEKPPTEKQPLVSMPWQIETHNNGTSTVFGITLEQTTVEELLNLLGPDHDIAIISDQQDNSGLEVYYGYFSAGPIKGKLIARINADDDTLYQMQARAASSEYIDTGSRKFVLATADFEQIKHWPVQSLSLVPAANLDESVILGRFGSEAERIHSQEGVEHFLYPEKGLDVTLYSEGKELLQYVAPRSFDLLTEPLKKIQTTDTESN
ncbi:hypothetical protein KOI40_11175 [Aestuariicella sp. G3-2]|uniref:hypothetical protein n=1 Tax=Pseudomaricurvus albidus TaxID=2842452 RepID=UPI001C0B955E|nr:hypothetical protein [Aestuariicella albida]MBU3070388.1 hypothetical protein [Aestuariicella albida]